jgi:hypothetical protein
MVKIKHLILITLFLIFLLPVANSIGLLSPEIGTIIYRTGYEQELTYYALNYNYDFEPYISGPIAKYMTIDRLTDSSTGMKQFNVKIKFPDSIELDPGLYVNHVGVREVGRPGGMVSALTAVQTKLRVEVLSNEKAITAEFDAPDANEKSKMTFRVDVRSATYQYISMVTAKITIYDDENNTLATFDTSKTSLESGQSKTLDSTWDNSALKPGNYRAEALVIFDGKTMLLEDKFKIGTLMIRINDYTDQFVAYRINEFKVDIENVWNNPVNNIYAELFVEGEKVLKTATINLNPWEKGTITSYWNVTHEPGEYNGKIKLYYADTYSEKNIKVKVREDIKLSAEHVYALIIIILMVLVIIMGVFLTVLYSKQRREKEKPNQAHKKIKRKKKSK